MRRRRRTLQPLVRRGSLGVALAALIVLVGASGALGYWSAQANVQAAAATARTGVIQSASPAGLVNTYSATAQRFAGSITLQNTGSRTASYAVALVATSATQATLPAAIGVAAAPVASAAACTATAPLSGAQTGAASSFTATGVLAAGASIILCLQTSMTASATSTYAGSSASLVLRGRLEYAPSDTWRVAGADIALTQGVAAAPPAPTMACTDNNGWGIDLRFTESATAGDIHYRLFLARESSPGARVPFTAASAPNPWWPVVQISPGSSSLQTYLAAPNGGKGNTWLFVERSATGASGPWTQVASGRFRTEDSAQGLRTWCGWK